MEPIFEYENIPRGNWLIIRKIDQLFSFSKVFLIYSREKEREKSSRAGETRPVILQVKSRSISLITNFRSFQAILENVSKKYLIPPLGELGQAEALEFVTKRNVQSLYNIRNYSEFGIFASDLEENLRTLRHVRLINENNYSFYGVI